MSKFHFTFELATRPGRKQPITTLMAGEAAIEPTDRHTDGRVLVHLSPHRAPRLKCLSPAARRGVFALIYTTEPSDTVEVIEITPAFSDKLINAWLN